MENSSHLPPDTSAPNTFAPTLDKFELIAAACASEATRWFSLEGLFDCIETPHENHRGLWW